MKTPIALPRLAAVVSLLVLAGCAGPTTPKDGIAKSDDYEYVTPLGSNIPVLVRKGQQPATTSPTATLSGEQAANAIHGGGQQMTPIKGSP
jgi:hypothetical protein